MTEPLSLSISLLVFSKSEKYLEHLNKIVSSVFQESHKSVPREIQGCFKSVAGVFAEIFKAVSRVFQDFF